MIAVRRTRRTMTTVASCSLALLVMATRCVPQTSAVVANPIGSRVVSAPMAGRLVDNDRIARIALAGAVTRAPVSATSRWRIDEQDGRDPLVKGTGGERWRIEQRGTLLRVAGDGDDVTPWRQGAFVARPSTSDALVLFNGKRYRGELWFVATDSGILVVNRLPVEDYLRGVVSLEMGTRQLSDRSALEAQAVAARSYSYIRVPATRSTAPAGGWHMLATVTNQVYGGVEAEHPLVNQAIDATAGLVLKYAGQIVDASYFSSCGGRTATPRDAWRDAKEQPYLPGVDDTDLTTGRPFCDVNPRNHWTEELNAQQLSDAVRRALEVQGATAPQSADLRGMEITDHSTSGRVGALLFHTSRGDIRIAARDVRAVLRDARGAILSSTYFSVDHETRSGSRLTGVTLRGNGNGHGVGMCQWGAIGRARAGQDTRTILRHYFPGTVLGFVE